MARAAARRRGQSSHSGTESGCGRQGRGRGARGVSVQRGRSPLCTAKTFQRRAAMPSRDTLHASDCALSNRTTLRLKLRVCHRGSRKRSGCVSAGAAHGVLCARSVRRAVGAAGPPGCAPSVGACGSVRAARGTGRARRLSAPAERSVGTPDRRGGRQRQRWPRPTLTGLQTHMPADTAAFLPASPDSRPEHPPFFLGES